MSPSPSGPYKSRMVRGVVQQVRRLLNRGQTTVRQVQVAASWSAQILLYPVYALFQTSRLLGKTLERSQDEARLELERPERYDIPLTIDAAPMTAETPLQNVLQTLQSFDLPTNCMVQVSPAETIRAIASQLDSHDLVLVTNTNQLLTLPDPNQQAWLKQRLIYEIALVNQQQRSRSLPWQSVIRVIQGISSTIRRRFAAPSTATDSLPPARTEPNVTSDRSIQRSLLAVRQWLATTDAVVVPTTSLERSRLASQTAPLKTAKIQIRGLASQIQDRQLVLVSRTNDIVHILSAEQAALLQQRIAWETAHYQRYLKLQEEVTTTLAPLRPPAPDRLLLPPIRVFQRLMAWMQVGPVALATNLFQEATWMNVASSGAVSHPAPVLPPSANSSILPQVTRRLPLRSPAQLRPGSPLPSPTVPSLGLESALQANTPSTIRLQPYPANLDQSAKQRSREYIDTDVTWVGYEQSWLERVMRWLDQIFLRVEAALSQLWRGVIGK